MHGLSVSLPRLAILLYGPLALLVIPVYTYDITGMIISPPTASDDWHSLMRVHVNGGQYLGFVERNGEFTVCNVPPGSYLVEFIHPDHIFTPCRVDISYRTGNVRARKVKSLEPYDKTTLPYPLRVSGIGPAMYFEQREQLNTLELLMSPNVLLMVVPFLIILILPKLMDTSDPDLQKEMQQFNILNSNQMALPNLSEMLSNFSSKKPTGSGTARSITSSTGPGSGSAACSGSGQHQLPNNFAVTQRRSKKKPTKD